MSPKEPSMDTPIVPFLIASDFQHLANSFFLASCSLLEGDVLGQFTVDQIEGEWTISSKKPLDREDTEKYLLKVMASDGKFQATTEVEIFVLDINDNSPECGQVRRLFWGIKGIKGDPGMKEYNRKEERTGRAC